MIILIFFTILFCNINFDDAATCPPVCMIFCENGNVLDSNGCPTCKCKPSKICRPVGCKLGCPNGFAKGEDGCEICACAPMACQPVACEIFCLNGFDKDIFGCEVCRCKPGSIELCGGNVCPEGTECKVVSSGCENVPTGAQCLPFVRFECVKVCPDLKCRECLGGNAVDANGCRTCACKNPCEGRNCSAGFRCKMIPGKCPEVSIPENICVPIDTWKCVKICPVFKCMACKSGYITDKFGCPTCQCKDPCERNTCVEGEKCVPASSTQRYRCVPACTCPEVGLDLPACFWNPCANGCPRGSICCQGTDGCRSCLQCLDILGGRV